MLIISDLEALRRKYADRTWFDGQTEQPIVDVWLKHPKRRRYHGTLLKDPYFGIGVPMHEVLRDVPIWL
jgi:hypothetical protein